GNRGHHYGENTRYLPVFGGYGFYNTDKLLGTHPLIAVGLYNKDLSTNKYRGRSEMSSALKKYTYSLSVIVERASSNSFSVRSALPSTDPVGKPPCLPNT